MPISAAILCVDTAARPCALNSARLVSRMRSRVLGLATGDGGRRSGSGRSALAPGGRLRRIELLAQLLHLIAQGLEFFRARHAQALQRARHPLVEHVLELADAEAVQAREPGRRPGAAAGIGL